KRGNRNMAKTIKHEVFVYLVRNRDNVMLDAKIPNDRKFLLGETPARRIVRRVEQHGLGLLLERARQFFRVELVVRRTQWNPDRNPAGERDTGMIVFMRRLQNHNFLSGINDADQGGD